MIDFITSIIIAIFSTPTNSGTTAEELKQARKELEEEKQKAKELRIEVLRFEAEHSGALSKATVAIDDEMGVCGGNAS